MAPPHLSGPLTAPASVSEERNLQRRVVAAWTTWIEVGPGDACCVALRGQSASLGLGCPSDRVTNLCVPPSPSLGRSAGQIKFPCSVTVSTTHHADSEGPDSPIRPAKACAN